MVRGYVALNGTREAFVRHRRKAQVAQLAGMHTVCSLLFAALLPLIRRLATAGIVAANCVVMAARIAFAAATARRYFEPPTTTTTTFSTFRRFRRGQGGSPVLP